MRLIVIEGLDGSGKATQAGMLESHLQSKGERVMRISFPDYESESSSLVKLYLSGALGEAQEVNAYAASCFYAADRFISYQTIWKEPYLSGHTIIADRYATSNMVHQMSKLPKEHWDDYLRWTEDFEYRRMELPTPDIVLYLDMHPNVAKDLLQKRYRETGGEKDIHERNLQYQMLCREAAMYAAERLGWRVLTCSNGAVPFAAEDIFQAVMREIYQT